MPANSQAASQHLSQAVSLYPFDSRNPAVLFAFDTETFEQNHDIMLELGISSINSACSCEYHGHTIMSDAGGRRNGRYVADNMDRFKFGPSYSSSAGAAFRWFQDMANNAANGRMPCGCQVRGGFQVVVLGHGMTSDMDILDKYNCRLPYDTVFLDTQLVAWGLQDKMGQNGSRMKLSRILDWMSIDTGGDRCLHNAGNDAVYTMKAFQAMCETHQQLQPTQYAHSYY